MRHILLYTVFFFFFPTFTFAESSSNSVFYRNDGANVEFRVVIDEDDQDTPWLILQDQEGSPRKVSKEVLIGSDDIAGFSVRAGGLDLHFKLESWGKILETTRGLKGKRLAFIKNKVILISPRIYSTLIRSGFLDFGKDKKYQERILKDLPIQTRPAYLNSKEVYMQFQSKWINLHPNDLETMEALAHQYIDDKDSLNFKEALRLFEVLAIEKPKDRMIQTQLLQCHFELGQYDGVLEAGGNALLALEREDQLFIYALMGETHYAMGRKDEAVRNLESYLDRLKEITFQDNDEFSRRGSITRDKAIQKVKDRITYIQTH